MSDVTVWLVGRFREGKETWEVQGIFTDKARADAYAASGGELWFCMPVPLDEEGPEEVVEVSYVPARGESAVMTDDELSTDP
jgi:hypothetical protein